MKKPSVTASQPTERYGIAAVARLAGLAAPVIRVWEKRYAAVTPKRSGTQRRLYDAEDIERLRLLGKLTGHGHAIRTIALLSLAQLLRRLEDVEAMLPGAVHPGAGLFKRLLFVGTDFKAVLGDAELLECRVVAQFKNLEAAEVVPHLPEADLLVVQADTVFPETINSLRAVVKRCKARRSVLIYRFSSSGTLVAIARNIDGLSPLKAPASANQIRRECMVQINSLEERQLPRPPGGNGPIPERIYQDYQLARMATMSTAVQCECPRHIVELLQGLAAFETYSQQCEDKNPADALLHHFLHRSTAHVRRLMEETLRHLVRMEGIEGRA